MLGGDESLVLLRETASRSLTLLEQSKGQGKWLFEQLSSNAGTKKVLNLLERTIVEPSFLHRVEAIHRIEEVVEELHTTAEGAGAVAGALYAAREHLPGGALHPHPQPQRDGPHHASTSTSTSAAAAPQPPSPSASTASAATTAIPQPYHQEWNLPFGDAQGPSPSDPEFWDPPFPFTSGDEPRGAADDTARTEEASLGLTDSHVGPSGREGQRQAEAGPHGASSLAGPAAAAQGGVAESDDAVHVVSDIDLEGPDGDMVLVGTPDADWEFVDKQDAIEAVSIFLASYLATLPEARHMAPKELQLAVRDAIREMRKGRITRFLDWGRHLYRTGTFVYGGFQLFSNPWVVQAVMRVLWAAARFFVMR